MSSISDVNEGSVAARNFRALSDAAKDDRAKREELQERVKQLEHQVAMQAADINALRQMIVTSLVARGHGATSRS